jgi:DNA repair photolyase
MPGINDSPEQVQPIVDRAREAKASFLGGVALHLRDEVKDVFFAWLEAKRPDLIPRYEKLYRDRSYMSAEQRNQATRSVRGWGRSTRRAKEGRQPSQLADTQNRRPSGGDLSDERAAVPPPQTLF